MIPIVVKGHERPISQLLYNREGDLLFSTARDKRVCIWFSENGELFGTTNQHNGSVLSIDVDLNSRLFATASSDFQIQFWQVKTGNRVMIEHTDLQGEVTTADRVSYEASPKFLQFHPHQPQNKMFVVRSKQMKEQSALLIYDMDISSDTLVKLTHKSLYLSEDSPITKAAWTYDGKRIITAHENGTIKRINAETGEIELQKKLHTESIVDVQMSKDRTYFVTASRDSTSMLVPVDGDFEAFKIKYQGDVGLNSAAISPINDIVIAGGGIKSVEVTTSSGVGFESHFFHKLLADDLGRIPGHFGPINTIAIHPFGTSYASGSEDGFVRIHHFDKSYMEFSLGK